MRWVRGRRGKEDWIEREGEEVTGDGVRRIGTEGWRLE